MSTDLADRPFVEHRDVTRQRVEWMHDPHIVRVRHWWAGCILRRGGKLPTLRDIDALLGDPELRSSLGFVDHIDCDPSIVIAGDIIAMTASQKINGIRLSEFTTTEDNKHVLRAAFKQAINSITPTGTSMTVHTDAGPDRRIQSAYFPVASPEGRAALLMILRPELAAPYPRRETMRPHHAEADRAMHAPQTSLM